MSSPLKMQNPNHNSSDNVLIHDVLNGNVQKFDQLISRYRDRVYQYLLKFIGDPDQAEDLSQDTFLTAYNRLISFQYNSAFLTWLIGIARNKALSYLTRSPEKKYRFLSSDIFDTCCSKQATPLETLEKKERLTTLYQCLEELPAELREIIKLVSLESFTYEEASQITQIPVGTVKSRLFRARELLKLQLETQKIK